MRKISRLDSQSAIEGRSRAKSAAPDTETRWDEVFEFGREPATGAADLMAPDSVLALQRTVGNQAVNRLMARFVQRDEDEAEKPPTPGPIAPPPSKAKARWGALKNLTAESAKFNKGTTPTKSSDSSKQTTTAGGAWLASQVNSREKIGSVDDYMGSRDDAGSAHSEHLKQFASGAHAFITPAIHRNIHNLPGAWANFGGWGSDANFVAPLNRADELISQAAGEDGHGIWDLEEKLGIPKGSWVKACAPDYNVYRYIIHDTARFNLRIPSGNERGAYASEWWNDKYQRGQWEPKGTTEGGAAEAVIDKIAIDDMKLLGKDVFEIVNDTSLAANTRKYLPDGPTPKPAG
jgi:hypothetical protein